MFLFFLYGPGAHLAPYSADTGLSFLGAKAMEALSLPSPPSSSDVNKWIYKSTARIRLYSLHKDKFLSSYVI